MPRKHHILSFFPRRRAAVSTNFEEIGSRQMDPYAGYVDTMITISPRTSLTRLSYIVVDRCCCSGWNDRKRVLLRHPSIARRVGRRIQ